MTRPDIDAIKARVEATTEGPWSIDKALDSNEYSDVEVYGVQVVAQTVWFSDSDMAHTALETMSAEDAEFISNARTDVPELLAYIEQLEEVVDSLERQIEARTGETAGERLLKEKCMELEAQIERVRGLHKPVEIEPSETICGECSNRLPNGRFLPVVEYPCPTIKALGG